MSFDELDFDDDPGFDVDLFSSEWEGYEREAVHKSLLEGINTPNNVRLSYPDGMYYEAMKVVVTVLHLPKISAKKLVNNCYPSSEKIDAAIAFICASLLEKKDGGMAPWNNLENDAL
uniref:Uncharacterized protein n=1 Tax=Proboscia inermis TaxID=420281 RepID=A0A7S0GJF8_9STRA|mmetsp:Transcript_9477/g.9581  ORF Transcript_9477/g.9581 Transcript_9477/m.9581 type:complete len:117 (+) Transcript_9477:254-604(+)|eukprot:CAMPEP_0171314190 /NCGR_PEP_ID=MMETSP0816-20121228/49708_1 /TAXON_ID=420281 /ORGANISM="Proboscia inermis, Strain CCAP1064/1" /LENGTH=116 /DNA_ID=CAMNT_0011802777 /DNA_START=203 /DNA_END=553 /DNA_ORIENTATION=-